MEDPDAGGIADGVYQEHTVLDCLLGEGRHILIRMGAQLLVLAGAGEA